MSNSVFDKQEKHMMAVLFFGPLLLVTLPLWLPVLLSVKLFQVLYGWLE